MPSIPTNTKVQQYHPLIQRNQSSMPLSAAQLRAECGAANRAPDPRSGCTAFSWVYPAFTHWVSISPSNVSKNLLQWLHTAMVQHVHLHNCCHAYGLNGERGIHTGDAGMHGHTRSALILLCHSMRDNMGNTTRSHVHPRLWCTPPLFLFGQFCLHNHACRHWLHAFQ